MSLTDSYQSDSCRYRKKKEPFHVYLMSQSSVVQEDKRDPVFLVPSRNSPSSFICKERTVSKNANAANTFRISSGSFLDDWIHVNLIGP